MDERIKQLFRDLEQYIQDNWVDPGDAEPSESLIRTEDEMSLSDDQERTDAYSKDGTVFTVTFICA